jgi:hypothetical protein
MGVFSRHVDYWFTLIRNLATKKLKLCKLPKHGGRTIR